MNYISSTGTPNQALQGGHTVAAAYKGDWKTQAIATYQQRRQHEDSALRIALAQRVRALTGRAVDVDTIWVDLDERIALASVDGVRFQLQRSQLAILRPCDVCGSGQFASPPLASQADLGYALSAWQPRHPQCQPEDPLSW